MHLEHDVLGVSDATGWQHTNKVDPVPVTDEEFTKVFERKLYRCCLLYLWHGPNCRGADHASKGLCRGQRGSVGGRRTGPLGLRAVYLLCVSEGRFGFALHFQSEQAAVVEEESEYNGQESRCRPGADDDAPDAINSFLAFCFVCKRASVT